METYRSPRTLSFVTIVLLALNAALVLVSTPSALMQLSLLERMERGDFTEEEALANDMREGAIGICTLVLYLATAVMFMIWLYRAYENTRAFGHTPRHGTGWAAGAWFVPILNLFRPFQIVREVWCASDPDARPEDVIVEASPAIVVVWWASWIIGNITGQIAFRLSLNAETIPGLQAATMSHVANDAVTLVSAVLAALVVHGITKRHEARAARRLSDDELAGLEQTFG